MIVAAGLFALLLAELAGLALVRPDPRGSGSLFGVVLPPYRVFAQETNAGATREAEYSGLVVDGRRITVGDVAGYHRLDRRLGYTTLESAESANGWWQSNEIGARESVPTERKVAPGKTRWLLFGESFAHGSGLPGPQGWAEIAEARDPGLDIINLAVDGYSMAQAFLRYQLLNQELDHHGVLLMFVPGVDLWRDVNVVRELGEPWKVRAVMPRFVLDGEAIRLLENPGIALRDHLRRFDRFYFRVEHEPVPVIGSSLIFRLTVAAWGRYERGKVRRAQLRPGSEALEVSRRIFLEMQKDTTAQAREFVLLVLPTATDLERLRVESSFADRWQRLVSSACEGLRRCVDLMPALSKIPPAAIDLGPDGNHYGPRTNAAIAAAVQADLMPNWTPR